MTGPWRKSSRSSATDAANPGSCVVFRTTDGIVEIGDSKLGATTPVLRADRNDIARVLARLAG